MHRNNIYIFLQNTDEWINTTQLSKIWEQMSEAYESGIREAWIVNAGDLKGNELPLSYFMAMAYNMEKWGYGNPANNLFFKAGNPVNHIICFFIIAWVVHCTVHCLRLMHRN